MPTSANITTAGVIAFTLPVGTWGVRVINESDTLIRRLLGQPATTSGTSLGLPLAAGAGETLVFRQPLKQDVDYCAIHAGTGDKTLTYEIITQPTQGGTGPSSSAGGSGASNALLLAGGTASTLGSLTAATAATGGLFYGTQGGADRKFTLTAAGAALVEAASASAQRTALNCPGLASANIFSVSGAASTPALSLTGTPFTGGTATTTKPLFSIEPTGTTSTGWSTSGTMLGVNAASGFAGNLVDIQKNGVSRLSIPTTGYVNFTTPTTTNSGLFLTTNGWANGHSVGITFGDTTLFNAIICPFAAPMSVDHYYGVTTVGISPGGKLGFNTASANSIAFGTSADALLIRKAAASFGFGIASATPITQTFGGADGSGTNITGGTLNIGTRGTGTGTGGRINLQFHAAGSSGSTLGTLVDVLSIVGVGRVRITGIPTSAAGLSTGDIYSNAGILTIV